MIGTLLSLVPAVIMLRHDGSRIFHRPDWTLLRRLGKVAMAHNWLNLAIATPPKLIPVLVTVVVSPSANATFYVAWMMASFLFMVPASLSIVLFAIASAAPELIAEKLRFVLRLSVMIGLPAMAVLALGAHFALGLFGASYVHLGTVPLRLLILTYIPGLPKAQYIAVCRATGRVAQAAVLLTVAAACELGAVVIGGKLGGLNGLSFGYLGVMVVEGIVTAPTVFRAAYSQGRHRRAAGRSPWPRAILTACRPGGTHHARLGCGLGGTRPGRGGRGVAHRLVASHRAGRRTAPRKVPRHPTGPLRRSACRFVSRRRGVPPPSLAGLDVLVALATPGMPLSYLKNSETKDQSGNPVRLNRRMRRPERQKTRSASCMGP